MDPRYREMICFNDSHSWHLDHDDFTAVGVRHLTIEFITSEIPATYQKFLAYLSGSLLWVNLGNFGTFPDDPTSYTLVLVNKQNNTMKRRVTAANYLEFKTTTLYDIWCTVVGDENMHPDNNRFLYQQTEDPDLRGAQRPPQRRDVFQPSNAETHNQNPGQRGGRGTASESVLYDCVHLLANRVGFLERSLGTSLGNTPC